MKTLFKSKLFLLFAVLLAFSVLFAQKYFASVNTKALTEIAFVITTVAMLIVGYFFIKEKAKATRMFTELALREEYLRETLNSLEEGVITTDTNGIIQQMNPSAEALTGWSHSEAMGKQLQMVYSVVNEETGKPFENIVSRILASGKRIEFENNTILKKKDNNEIIISNSGSPISGLDGNIVGSVLVFRDITFKKRAQEDVMHSRQHLQTILDQSMDVICTINADGEFVTISAACENLWGYRPEELIGKKYIDLVFEEDHLVTNLIAKGIMMGLEETNFENRYKHKNGNLTPIIWSARWDEGSNLMYAIARDATEKKNAEKLIAAERLRLSDLFMNAPVSMCIMKGENHVFELANPIYQQLIGKKNIIGRSVREVLPEIDGQGFLELLDKVYKTGVPYKSIETLVKIDVDGNGEMKDIYLNFVYQPYRNEEGVVSGVFYFGIDVSEQVLARKTIEHSYELLQSASVRQSSILNALPANIALLNKEGAIIEVNDAWKDFARSNNYQRENYALGENYIEVLSNTTGDDEPTAKQMARGISNILAGDLNEFSLEYPCHSPYEKRWYQAKVSPTERGKYAGAVVMHIDITERKAAEEEIRQSKANLTAIIENTDAHVYSLDREFRYIAFNSHLQRSMKAAYGRDIKIGDIVFEFLKESNQSEALEWEVAYKEALTGKLVQFEKDYSQPGNPGFISVSINPIWENDSVIGLSCFARDITQGKLAENALKENSYVLQKAQEVAHLGHWISVPGRLGEVIWSDETYRILGLDKKKVTVNAELFLSVVHPDDRVAVGEMLKKVLAGGGNYEIEHRIIRPDGNIRWVREQADIVYGDGGIAQSIIGVCQDITNSKMAEDKIKASEAALRKLNAELEDRVMQRTAELTEANHELEAFSYTVSHDLRTPIRAIQIFGGLLQKRHSDGDESFQNDLANILKCTIEMNDLINDLLAFSKLGRTELIKTRVDMEAKAREVTASIIGMEEWREVEVKIDRLPPVDADATLIKSVWMNLISNAVKYNRKDTPTAINISSKVDGEFIVYMVQDNGIGFDMKYYNKLFKPFSRLHTSGEYKGTGAGLAICDRIIKKHGGKIWCESKLDEGSIFYFSLPFKSQE